MQRLLRILTALVGLMPLAWAAPACAQYNTDRLMVSGEIALHYEDYVLSIQYFNRVISLKPYLYQPWQYRAAAKFYLEDFTGAETDATEAIRLNPYIDALYDLRAICRIRLETYSAAIDDYSAAIRLNPDQRNFWFNRALCRVNVKDYAQAHLDVDTLIRRWSGYAPSYSLKAEIYLHEQDTTEAARWLEKSLEMDPYDAGTWTTRAYISLARQEWRDADKYLGKAIHLKPKQVANYVNRALARYNYNNLSGAMADYDTALDLDPSNFMAHYNRGRLRMQLGDNNRAIADFDYVIRMEPHNYLAIFNRAVLHDLTGDLRAAIRDYTEVIDQFPNFWTGLSYRARAYRRLGMTGKAEMDEFKILKAQMDKRLGKQPRWSKAKQQAMRKRSEIDPEKYNQLVVEDEQGVDHEYKSEFRGRVQNRAVEAETLPLYALSFFRYDNGISRYQAFDREVEQFNERPGHLQRLFVTCNSPQLNEEQSTAFFDCIAAYSAQIDAAAHVADIKDALLLRAVAYSSVQDYASAISDLTAYIQTDSTQAMGYWQRAVCQQMLDEFEGTRGTNATDHQIRQQKVREDLARAISLAPACQYLYYDRGGVEAAAGAWRKAIDDYTHAIKLDPNLAEAYYNRGLAHNALGDAAEAMRDLSRAGELGIYDAYSVIKRISAAK